jgi:HTH-type transcriptional regulator/antitoxin HipB
MIYSENKYIVFIRFSNIIKLFVLGVFLMKHLIVTEQQLGQLLQGVRKTAGMTQAQLARRAGISQARLSVLELNPGRLTVARLLNILNALGLTLAVEDASTAQPEAPTNVTEW